MGLPGLGLIFVGPFFVTLNFSMVIEAYLFLLNRNNQMPKTNSPKTSLPTAQVQISPSSLRPIASANRKRPQPPVQAPPDPKILRFDAYDINQPYEMSLPPHQDLHQSDLPIRQDCLQISPQNLPGIPQQTSEASLNMHQNLFATQIPLPQASTGEPLIQTQDNNLNIEISQADPNKEDSEFFVQDLNQPQNQAASSSIAQTSESDPSGIFVITQL